MLAAFEAVPVLYSAFHDPLEIMEACRVAAASRLAVNGWVFFELFRQGKEGISSEYKIEKITMAHSNVTGEPVGCAVAFHAWNDLNAGCFVRSCHRRMGVGSTLIQTLLLGLPAVRIHNGITGSMDFWRRCGANPLDYIGESRQINLEGC